MKNRLISILTASGEGFTTKHRIVACGAIIGIILAILLSEYINQF